MPLPFFQKPDRDWEHTSQRQRFVERGTPAEKIHVVRNVPDQDYVTDQNKTETDYFQLLIHGLISERYGHETAIRAVKLLRDKIKNIHLNDVKIKNLSHGLHMEKIDPVLRAINSFLEYIR